MRLDAGGSLNFLLKELNRYLRPLGFKRSGQRFGRQSSEVWQVISVQISRWSSGPEKRLTINFGITPNCLIEFHDGNLRRIPLDYTCPINFRIGELVGAHDLWWDISDEGTAIAAFTAISAVLDAKANLLLNQLCTNQGILNYYASGKVMGFEINRDEARLILLSVTGRYSEARTRRNEYESKWVPAATSERANAFLQRLKSKFPSIAE
jgi:hypothetical protein